MGGRRIMKSARMLLELHSKTLIVLHSAIPLSQFAWEMREIAMGNGVIGVGGLADGFQISENSVA